MEDKPAELLRGQDFRLRGTAARLSDLFMEITEGRVQCALGITWAAFQREEFMEIRSTFSK